MRSSEPEVFEIRPDPPWKRSLERIRNAAGRRLQGLLPRRRLENSVSGSRQTFDLSGGEPSFDEISRIVSDPRVCAAIEAIPQGNLAVDLPSPRFPRGYESLGFSKRSRPAAVIDIVPFGLELDTLELRLVELDAVVDRFVVVECERSFGGIRKPLYLKRNWDRFARFHQKIEHVILDPSIVDRVYPEQRRQSSDWKGELAVRSAMWDRVRRLSFPEDPVLVSADADEIPSRDFLHTIKHFRPQAPIRLRAPALRYNFSHFDPEASADILVISGEQHLSFLDQHPDGFRSIPGPTLECRGSVHLTSFLSPLALLAKIAMTTEWTEALVPWIRNDFGSVGRMIEDGHWFHREMHRYDPVGDERGLVPRAAVMNRLRYAHFWKSRATS